ncbi:hypothetical protein ACFL49_01150 [Candidatus Omnitrophota bacterium]
MEITFKTFFNLKVLAVLLIFGLLFFLDLNVKKNMREKEVTQLVVEILDDWKSGDLTRPMEKWEDFKSYPPINNLLSYDISRVRFFKDQDKHLQAQFLVRLDFPLNGPLPTGKRWIFKLNNSNYKWKVSYFDIAE